MPDKSSLISHPYHVLYVCPANIATPNIPFIFSFYSNWNIEGIVVYWHKWETTDKQDPVGLVVWSKSHSNQYLWACQVTKFP